VCRSLTVRCRVTCHIQKAKHDIRCHTEHPHPNSNHLRVYAHQLQYPPADCYDWWKQEASVRMCDVRIYAARRITSRLLRSIACRHRDGAYSFNFGRRQWAWWFRQRSGAVRCGHSRRPFWCEQTRHVRERRNALPVAMSSSCVAPRRISLKTRASRGPPFIETEMCEPINSDPAAPHFRRPPSPVEI